MKYSLFCLFILLVLMPRPGIDLEAPLMPGAEAAVRPQASVTPPVEAPLPSCSELHQVKTMQTGIASWYGPGFHGQKTSSGETYNMYQLTAAHRTLPLNTQVRVINKLNNESVVLRINDRGPYVRGRLIDLSLAAAERLDMRDDGVTPVELEILCRPEPGRMILLSPPRKPVIS